MVEVSRRAVARGALWSVPAVTVASGAPAEAASCPPTTENRVVAVQWTATLLGFSASDGSEGSEGSDIRRLRYTFTNSGPDAIPAGISVDLRYVVTVDSTDWSSTLVVENTSANAQASVTSTNETDEASGQITYRFHVTITTAGEVAKDATFTVDVRFMYGLLAGTSGALGHPEGSTVGMESPQTVTDRCATTIVAGTIDGSDDETVWSYP